MKIEIHIKDTDNSGKKIGFKNLYMESCRVYKEPKDGLRLDNLSQAAYSWFFSFGNSFVKAIKEDDIGWLGKALSTLGIQ